jgi:4-aminobutyrate aminotransferase/(S)-3-amino-2-methylpropionate transaminase
MARDVSHGVPGGKSEELLKRRDAAVPRAVFNTAPIFVESGEGATVTDVDGNTFIDFAGGLGVLNVGRNNPRVLEAVRAQLEQTMHECFHVAMYEEYVALAEALNEITPGDFDKKTMLANSGAEAVENAVKVARYATDKDSVVGFTNGFHGRTLMAMTLTAKEMPYKHGFGPFAPEVFRVPFAYCYRCPINLTYPDCGVACVDYAMDIIDSQIGAETVACAVVEPVQGEGGFVVSPPDWLPALADALAERDILLIDDEVQTGMGRTGTMLAVDQFEGVIPDIVATSKSLGSGLPISGVTGRADLMEAPHVGGLGGTFGGNPVAAAAALAVIGELREGDLLERARILGTVIRRRLDPLVERLEIVGEVRGLGPMVGVELVTNSTTKEPSKKATGAVVRRCIENGVLILKAGTYDNVVRMLTPLVISDHDMSEGLDVLVEALEWANTSFRET